MGDVVVQKARQGRPYKFVFKRKLRNLDESSEDEMFNRLIYLQAADEVITGNVPVSSLDSVVDLTAKSVAVDLGEDFPTDADGLVDAEVMEYVPVPVTASSRTSSGRRRCSRCATTASLTPTSCRTTTWPR